MKKNVLALAALAALAGSAYAQSSVEVFGVVDIGISRESGIPGANDTVTKLDGSGLHSGNRVGFRGTEDLGNGLKASFVLESGFNSDTGAQAQGLLYGRQAWLGLDGGFGTVRFGRQYTPHWQAIDAIDPTEGISGGVHNLMRRTVRTDNTINYATPKLGGFQGQVAYTLGEVAGDAAASSQLGLGATYAGGPVLVKLAYHEANNATDTDSAKNTFLGASYNFGFMKAFAGYQTEKGLAAIDRNDAFAGVSVPFGANTIMASYTRKNDKAATDEDAKMWSLAYTYAFSKRTNLYASYVNIDNDNAGNTLVYRPKGGDSAGDTELNVGIRHKF